MLAQKGGVTALNDAVFHDQEECIKVLLEAGADAGVPEIAGSTPLFTAAIMERTKCLEALLTFGKEKASAIRVAYDLAMEGGNKSCADIIAKYARERGIRLPSK